MDCYPIYSIEKMYTVVVWEGNAEEMREEDIC
jgi:hypothetical protein